MLDKLVADPIPNIRFNVAKSYAVLIDTLKRLPETGTLLEMEKQQQAGGGPLSNGSATGSAKSRGLVTQYILPNLEKLQADDDVDVRYFSTTAAQCWGSDEMQMSP